MKHFYKTKNIALATVMCLGMMLPSIVRAQDASEYFTVVLFGDPEIKMTTREGNNATVENISKWVNGIIHMHENTTGYFNFQNQPEGFTPKADLVICMGDMDEDNVKSNSPIKPYFDMIKSAGIPFITMIGNHDVVPDRWNGGDVGATSGGHNANKYAFDFVTSYLTAAQGNGIENVKRFESANGVNQAKPFTFTFRGVRFYIGQTYWFQKTYNNNTPLFGSGTPPTCYIPYDVVNELDNFVQTNASTPSVWVQHYPIDAADRWWNDCNENGVYVTPANEDANMKTAAQKRARYKEIIAKSTNPWHFSGHQHSAYKRTYTNNSKSFTDHVAPYFATNGSAYIALCRQGVGVVEVRQVCFDPAYQTPTVSNLGQLSNDKAYTIRCANGRLTYNTSVTNAVTGSAGTLDNTDINNHWSLVTQNGNNYLYNIAAGKFARKPANSTASQRTKLELVDTPDANSLVTLEFNNSDPDYPWVIKFGGVILNVSTGYTDTHGIAMGGWSTLDGGNRYAISEVDDFSGFQTVKEKLTNAGMADLVSIGNLTTGWYQLWTEATEVARDTRLITSADQLSSPKSDTHDSGAEGHLENLIDDNLTSYWHSQWGTTLEFGSAEQMKHYVQFDLGDAYQNLTFVYSSRHNNDSNKPTAFAVTASNDANGTFTQVATISNVSTDRYKIQTFPLDLGARYRYIRLRATATNSNNGFWHASEMQFYPGEYQLPQLITSTSQMSSPKPAPGDEGVLGRLIDGANDTYWHSNWNGESPAMNSEAQMLHYVQFDLGSGHRDLTLAYRCRNFHSDKPTAFAVTASNEADGTFTQVATISGVSTDPNELQYFHFDMGLTYRYIRLRATATGGTNNNRGYWHAAEMQFYDGEIGIRKVPAYYKTLNISSAPTVNGNIYDMASAENSTDLNTLFYIEKVGNGQVKFHLPTGYGVGTGCSRVNEATGNVITVTAPDANPALLQLKNDAAHGGSYWAPSSDASYADGFVISTGSASHRWKLFKANEMMMDNDVWTVMPAVEGAGMSNVTYTVAGYTGVSEFTKGGKLILPKGVEPSPEDFTVAEEGATVTIDADNKQILVNAKIYRLGQRITDLSQIQSGGKYMIINSICKNQWGIIGMWVKNNNGNFALESKGLPAALREAPLDANVFADKMWTFTTVTGGYSISNGSMTQNISCSDYALAGDNLKGGKNNDYIDPRFYFEDMDGSVKTRNTCAAGEGYWLIRNGISQGNYWNAMSGPAFLLWGDGHPYTIFAVEEATGLEVNYGVNASAQGFMNRSDNRHYEWVSLKVNSDAPVKIEGLQQKTGNADEFRPIYFNRTGQKLFCHVGDALTAAVDGTNTSGMHALFFIDRDGDGFEDGEGVTSSSLEVSGITAPTEPGTYRVRFLVVNGSTTDPAGYANIATDGGIIVDAMLEVIPTSCEVVIKDGWGYGSYYNSKYDLTVPNGYKAYTFSFDDNISTRIVAKELTAGVIPAGTGVIVKGAETAMFPATQPTAAAVEGNLLKGTDESKTVTTEDDGVLYMLSRTTGKGVGFYQASQSGKSFTNGAHKAYLDLPVGNAQSGVRMILFSDLFNGTETGVAQPVVDEQMTEYYDLSGRRVNGRPASGIYIVNGKKHVLK